MINDTNFDWLDEGGNRLFAWCVRHWLSTLSILIGTPILAAGLIGFILGRSL
ncbi:hypothetical protein GURKE_04450 [Brevundimonas phage vB_BpoS-Gurke]|uniref:Uncharacterized protein n=1 Tax=Brevundimonas phage vB_BpoS-Gurke TaxID=2948599 RepID=A0A9E7STL1_9CAUD|nr:hypothetical protein GURKE_04450 [Brevundimonas phage vB_BpoS-Gurke]